MPVETVTDFRVVDSSSSLSPSLPPSSSLSSESRWIYTPKDSEQEQPVTPKAGLTPRASYSNVMFTDAHETCANLNDQELQASPLPGLFPSHSSTQAINSPAGNDSDPFNDNFKLDFGATASASEDLYDTSRKPILDDPQRPIPCSGQPVEWTPGSVWDSYAYQMHDDDSLP